MPFTVEEVKILKSKGRTEQEIKKEEKFVWEEWFLDYS